MSDSLPTATVSQQRRSYTLAALATYLHRAGQYERLHKLFANHNWLHARYEESGHNYDGFLADLTLVRDATNQVALSQIATGVEPAALAPALRYALLRSTIHLLGRHLSPESVVAALRTGIWSLERTLSFTEQRGSIELNLALMAAGLLSDRALQQVAEQALQLALDPSPGGIGNTLEKVLPYLRGEGLYRGLREYRRRVGARFEIPTLAAIYSGEGDSLTASILAEELAKFEAEPRLTWLEASEMRKLAPWLDGDLLARALVLARRITSSADAAWTAGALGAGEKDLALQARALETVLTGNRPDSWQRGLSALLPHLPAAERERAFERVLAVPREDIRFKLLQELAPLLQGEQLQRVARDTLQASDWEREQAALLLELAPRLDAANAAEVVAVAAQKPADGFSRRWTPLADDDWTTLMAIAAGQLEGAARQQAVERVMARLPQISHRQRAAVLAIVAEASPAGERAGLMRRALVEVADPTDAGDDREAFHAHSLQRLLPLLDVRFYGAALEQTLALPPKQRPTLLRMIATRGPEDVQARAVDALLALPDGESRQKALDATLPQLPARLVEKVIRFQQRHALEDFMALALPLVSTIVTLQPSNRHRLFRFLLESRGQREREGGHPPPGDGDPAPVLDGVLETILGLPRGPDRIRLLAQLLPVLKTAQLQRVVAGLPDLIADIEPSVLQALAHALAENEMNAALSRMLESVRSLAAGQQRAALLVAVREVVPGRGVREAAEAVLALDNKGADAWLPERLSQKAALLLALIPALETPLLVEAVFAAALAMPDDDPEGLLLEALLPALTAGQLARIVARPELMTARRVHFIEILAGHLREGGRQPLLLALWEQVRAVKVSVLEAEMLTRIAPCFAPPEREQMLADALALAAAADDYKTLAALVAQLDDVERELARERQQAALSRALEQARALPRGDTDDDFYLSQRLTGLASALDGPLAGVAAEIALAIPDEHARADAIVALFPRLDAAAREQALAAALAVDDDHARHKMVAGVIPYLDNEQWATVMDTLLMRTGAPSTAEDARVATASRERALVALAAHLPASLASRWPAIVDAITDDLRRAQALAALVNRVAGVAREEVLREGIEVALRIPSGYSWNVGEKQLDSFTHLLAALPEVSHPLGYVRRGVALALRAAEQQERATILQWWADQRLLGPAALSESTWALMCEQAMVASWLWEWP